MSSREREMLKVVLRELAMHGITKPSTKSSGKGHTLIQWTGPNGHQRTEVIPSSPGDSSKHAILNARAQVRRRLRADGLTPA